MEKAKKKGDILEMILSGERITKKIKTKRGTFVMVFPLPRDLKAIEVDVARSIEGLPSESFTKSQMASFRAYATLDHLITDGPEWWKQMDSAEDCPDDALITHLYGRYLRLYQTTQKSISESKFNGDDGVGKTGNALEIVGN